MGRERQSFHSDDTGDTETATDHCNYAYEFDEQDECDEGVWRFLGVRTTLRKKPSKSFVTFVRFVGVV